MEAKLFDLSQIDLEKLRDEFAKKVKRKHVCLGGYPGCRGKEAGSRCLGAIR